ncbi:hypothetical protein [Halogranum rubrum]|nr:hypothetical protein [Halogranum salarium]
MGPPTCRRHYVLVGVALLCTLLVSSVAPAVAAPPPEPFCQCGDAIEGGAAAHALDLTVTTSTATVQVHENGSATWVVRATTDADAATMARLRENATLRDSVVDGAAPGTLVSSAVDGDTVVARFRDGQFVEPSVGVLRSAAFTNHPERHLRLASLGTDELTVVAPEGMVVGRTVPGSTVSDDRSRMTLTSLDERDVGHVVTFEPRTAAFGPVKSLVAVAGFHAPTVAGHVGTFVLPSALVFAFAVGVVGSGVSWVLARTSLSGEFVPSLLTALGAVTTVVTVVGAVGGNLFGNTDGVAIGFSLGLAALGVCSARLGRSYRALTAATATAALVGVVGAVVAALVVDGASLRAVSIPMTVGLSLAVFTLVPAGYAFARGRRWVGVVTATVGFVCFACALLPLTAPTVGLGGFLVFAFAAGYPLVASPLLLAGALLAQNESKHDGHHDTERATAAD